MSVTIAYRPDPIGRVTWIAWVAAWVLVIGGQGGLRETLARSTYSSYSTLTSVYPAYLSDLYSKPTLSLKRTRKNEAPPRLVCHHGRRVPLTSDQRSGIVSLVRPSQNSVDVRNTYEKTSGFRVFSQQHAYQAPLPTAHVQGEFPPLCSAPGTTIDSTVRPPVPVIGRTRRTPRCRSADCRTTSITDGMEYHGDV